MAEVMVIARMRHWQNNPPDGRIDFFRLTGASASAHEIYRPILVEMDEHR